jgi:hypothetical protein
VQLADRDVRAGLLQRVRAELGQPRGGLPAGLAQHEPAERHDQPGALGGRDELGRRDQPAGRVLPADQRLDADHPAGARLDDRLVDDEELAGVQRAAQLAAEPGVADHRQLHAAVVAHPVGLAALLGRVHGDVGVAQHGVQRGAGGRRGDPMLACTSSWWLLIGPPNSWGPSV